MAATSRSLDSGEFARARADAVGRALRFPGGDAGAIRAWQATLREKVRDGLGGFPCEPCDLASEVVERTTGDGFVRETLLFDSRAGLCVFAYLLLPEGVAQPLPAVICVPGHGVGVDDLVGLGPAVDARVDAATADYQHDMAIQWVRRGFGVLAVEPLGFGHRRDATARAAGPDVTSCEPAAGAALLLGETLLGWRVHDLVRAVDYAETRSELDASRLAICGISGGATAALFATALEPRLRAALLSGYLTSFGASIARKPHCICNYVPGLGRLCEMVDIAALVAPRPLFLEHGTRDALYPVDAACEAFEGLRPVWSTLGAPDAIGLEVFEGVHEFSGRRGLPFVSAALKD